MKVLLAIPHVFAPKQGSLYSSQTEGKRMLKQEALRRATIENLNRHRHRHWIHASLGKDKPVVTREQSTNDGIDLTIQLFTPPSASLASDLPRDPDLQLIDPGVEDFSQVPMASSKRLLEQAENYDIVGYMEDDLLIEDIHFFEKLRYLHRIVPDIYAFLPHRCEHIPGKGDVILSGDPDGGRKDLFWDTGETIQVEWPTTNRYFYRATNPHSGCFFLSQKQALSVRAFWEKRQWRSNFVLSGPLEQAGSGLLLPVLKLMKPVVEHYRFLMIRHQDELWKRHAFEPNQIKSELS
jgi:hypothetical protein